mgnify:CR=1 FL=1
MDWRRGRAKLRCPLVGNVLPSSCAAQPDGGIGLASWEDFGNGVHGEQYASAMRVDTFADLSTGARDGTRVPEADNYF